MIDGLDGSGKTTQVELAVEELNKLGYNTQRVKFPAYEYDSSVLVRQYLSGNIGSDADKINPYAASMFYMADRYIQFQTNLSEFISKDTDTVMICDRYISANIIHQGGKILDREERLKFYDWCYEFEVGKLGLPKETKVIMLTLKPSTSQKLMGSRYNNHEELKDIHEGNVKYLEKCYRSALEASIHNEWTIVKCDDTNGGIKSIEDIHKEVMKEILESLGSD